MFNLLNSMESRSPSCATCKTVVRRYGGIFSQHGNHHNTHSKVVELEIQLDEIKEQYNNVIRNSNSKAQQKKMAFLERNLEQLTLVQKQVSLHVDFTVAVIDKLF